MIRIVAVLSLLLFTGCAKELQAVKTVYSVVTETRVKAPAVVAAGNAFILAETAGTAYLTFCDGSPGDPKCSASTERLVIDYTRKGRSALNQMKAQLRASPDASASLYNTLVTALNAINSTPASTFGASQ